MLPISDSLFHSIFEYNHEFSQPRVILSNRNNYGKYTNNNRRWVISQLIKIMHHNLEPIYKNVTHTNCNYIIIIFTSYC